MCATMIRGTWPLAGVVTASLVMRLLVEARSVSRQLTRNFDTSLDRLGRISGAPTMPTLEPMGIPSSSLSSTVITRYSSEGDEQTCAGGVDYRMQHTVDADESRCGVFAHNEFVIAPV